MPSLESFPNWRVYFLPFKNPFHCRLQYALTVVQACKKNSLFCSLKISQYPPFHKNYKQLSLWAFQGKQGCPLSMNWVLTRSSHDQMVISYFAYSQNTSTAADRQCSSLFQIKTNSFCLTTKSPLPQKLLYWLLFHLFPMRDPYLHQTSNYVFQKKNHQKKGAEVSMWWSAQTIPCLEWHWHKLFRNVQHQYSV